MRVFTNPTSRKALGTIYLHFVSLFRQVARRFRIEGFEDRRALRSHQVHRELSRGTTTLNNPNQSRTGIQHKNFNRPLWKYPIPPVGDVTVVFLSARTTRRPRISNRCVRQTNDWTNYLWIIRSTCDSGILSREQ